MGMVRGNAALRAVRRVPADVLMEAWAPAVGAAELPGAGCAGAPAGA